METFVVRIWAPAEPEERDVTDTQVQGRLEHVTSGRRVAFRGTEELGTLIVHELKKASRVTGPSGPKEA